MSMIVAPGRFGAGVTIPVNFVLPVISGTGLVGQLLTVSNGTWSGTPTGYTYQWNRNGSPISGATSSSYTTTSTDNGTTITATVSATNAAGTASATSVGLAIGAVVHRYWRVVVYGREISGNVNTTIAEIEMRSSFGGADLCAGGTASANTVQSTNTADKAFDNDVTTNWQAISATVPPPDWIKYDFGVGAAVEVKELTIRGQGSTTALNNVDVQRAPREFGLEWSDDNVNWIQQFGVSGQTGWGVEQRRTFRASTGNAAVAKQLWRINVTAVNGSSTVSIREIEMHSTPGGADETTAAGANAGDAWASNTATTNRPYRAFNDVTTDFWGSSGGTALPAWVGFDFGQGVSKDIQEITIRADAATTAPNAFDVQYSNDGGTSWYTSWSVTGQTAWAVNEVRTFTKPAPPTDALLTSGDMQGGTDHINLSGDMATGHELIR